MLLKFGTTITKHYITLQYETFLGRTLGRNLLDTTVCSQTNKSNLGELLCSPNKEHKRVDRYIKNHK